MEQLPVLILAPAGWRGLQPDAGVGVQLLPTPFPQFGSRILTPKIQAILRKPA